MAFTPLHFLLAERRAFMPQYMTSWPARGTAEELMVMRHFYTYRAPATWRRTLRFEATTKCHDKLFKSHVLSFAGDLYYKIMSFIECELPVTFFDITLPIAS